MPEIERKWRAHNLDILELIRALPQQHLTQAYLITWPGELRVRTDGATCWLTAKSDGDLTREEWESEIPSWMFDQLFATTAHQIEKLRHQLKFGGYTWEIDTYQGALKGLITIEIECKTEEEAKAVVLPNIFGPAHEVTEDSRYKNKSLAASGLPD